MDIDYLLALQNGREALGGVFDDFFLQISDFSYGIFIWVLACIFFWAVNKKTGSFLFLNLGLARFCMQWLKLTFSVYRPWIRSAEIQPVETASGYSFPSGHAVTSTTNFGTLIRCYRRYGPLVVFLCVMIALTLFSRNYIGVHTPQDVVVGFGVALLVVIFAPYLWEWVMAKEGRVWYLLGGAIVLTVLFLIYISTKSYPMDYDADGELIVDPVKMQIDGWKDAGRFFGVASGWAIERKVVRFEVEGVPLVRRVTRCCWGLLILLVMEQVLIPWMCAGGELSMYFAAYWWELFVLICGWPALFKAIEDARDRRVPGADVRPPAFSHDVMGV